MDITSLYYFSEVAKDLHITKTAQRLYISQQTLSNHVRRLEEQLGAQLLNRKPKLSLTYAGEFVLGFADVVLREQVNLTDILSDIERNERGVIRFGASNMRMDILTFIFQAFSSQYPNVELRLTNVVSEKLEALVSNNVLDFAIVVSDKSDPNLLQEELMQDQIFLCVSDRLLREHYGENAEAIKRRSEHGARVKDFSKLPFCIFTNTMGHRIHRCFEDANYLPKVAVTSSLVQISTSIGLQGTVAFFATQANLASRLDEIPEDMNIFPLLYRDEPMYLQVSLLRHRQRYLTHFSKYFLELISHYCSVSQQTSVARLAKPTH